MGRRRYQHPSVRRTKAKRPSWYFRARVEVLTDAGVTERCEKLFHIGWCKGMGKRAAEKIRDAMLETINNKPLFVQSQVKFGKVLDAYERNFIPTLKPNSRAAYKSKIGRYIRPTFKDRQLHQVNVEAVQEWVNGIVAGGLGEAATKATVAVLSSVMDQAAAWEYTQQRNPCEFVRIGECKGKRTHDLRALTLEEWRRLLAVCDAPREVHIGRGRPTVVRGLGDMVRIATLTGIRAGEILALTWGAYQPPALWIRASRSQHGGATTSAKSKAGKRVLPLGPIVLQRPAGVSDDTRIFDCEYRAAHRALVEAAAEVGISFTGFGWHTMRRTYATMRSKVSRASLREAMGHATEEMSDHYVRESFADDVDAVTKMQALLIGDAKAGGKPS